MCDDWAAGSRVDKYGPRGAAWFLLWFVVGCGPEPISFLIAPVGVSSMVGFVTKVDGNGLSVNWLKPEVDACRLTDREFLLDGEIRDVDRRSEEADGLGKGVDAENPVDWPNGERLSCSTCEDSAPAQHYVRTGRTLTFQSGPIIVEHNLSISWLSVALLV